MQPWLMYSFFSTFPRHFLFIKWYKVFSISFLCQLAISKCYPPSENTIQYDIEFHYIFLSTCYSYMHHKRGKGELVFQMPRPLFLISHHPPHFPSHLTVNVDKCKVHLVFIPFGKITWWPPCYFFVMNVLSCTKQLAICNPKNHYCM